MELDDLKTAWQSLDRRLADQQALTLHVFEDNQKAEARSRLRPLFVAQGVKVAFGIVVCFLFAPYWIAHWGIPHLVLPALLFHVYGVLLIADGAREMHLIVGVEPAEPVVAIQKRLAKLTDWRVRMGKVHGILWCFLWIPPILVVFEWLGADLWAHAPRLVVWLLASGLVSLGILLGARAVTRRSNRLNVALFLDRSSEGRSVQRARSALEEILAFERE
jgi:hypothetical protein